MQTEPAPPTTQWLACVPEMAPLQGPAGTAERLLLLVHYGIDWEHGWVASYRARYWDDILPDRVIVATYRSASLRRWWSDVSVELGSTPRNRAERRELEELLRADPQPVLQIMRDEIQALALRVRITSEAVREARSRKATR